MIHDRWWESVSWLALSSEATPGNRRPSTHHDRRASPLRWNAAGAGVVYSTLRLWAAELLAESATDVGRASWRDDLMGRLRGSSDGPPRVPGRELRLEPRLSRGRSASLEQ